VVALIVLASMAVLVLGYLGYGRYLGRYLHLNDSTPTPAVQTNDGVDFVPAKAQMLLGQHFSAIAAAGPIVGPILAGMWFGWAPALAWIVLGSIFIGGPHDFISMVASIRHKAASVGELAREQMSRGSQMLYLVFIWIALIYVIVAFTDITAQTFTTVAENEAYGPSVVFSSFIYLGLGIAMGVLLRKRSPNLGVTTAVALALLFVVIGASTRLPDALQSQLLRVNAKSWEVVLVAYCFAASLIPMWLLLQPRGYLGGWFLYITMAAALFGALAGGVLGGFKLQYPAFNLDGLKSLANGRMVFPVLFITIACGACSGFHAIVSAGTTSKQIRRESDTLKVGYGAMILEGMVAILALATLMILPAGHPATKGDPNFIYARGLGDYMALLGVDRKLTMTFALLAFSTFVYDTLDVATRLARYILQEILAWKTRTGAVAATAITLALPLVILLSTKQKAYLVAWPIFGTSNQLLAALTLLILSVWLYRTGRNGIYTLIPMVFMLVVTVWSLVLQIVPFLRQVAAGKTAAPDATISGICGIILLVLSAMVVAEACRILARMRRQGVGKASDLAAR
jgi:carbon starvation protein